MYSLQQMKASTVKALKAEAERRGLKRHTCLNKDELIQRLKILSSETDDTDYLPLTCSIDRENPDFERLKMDEDLRLETFYD